MSVGLVESIPFVAPFRQNIRAEQNQSAFEERLLAILRLRHDNRLAAVAVAVRVLLKWWRPRGVGCQLSAVDANLPVTS